MIWQYSPYFIAYLACGVILAILAITGWRNRNNVCARPFIVLMLAASLWSFCTALELASADLATQMLAISIEYVGMVIIPVAWLFFALEYTGREHWITRSNAVLLCVIPAFTVIMVATNSYHYLYYTSVSEILYHGLAFHTVTYGPVFWLHSLYSYLLISVAIILVIHRFVFTHVLYRRQMMVILIATLIPFFVNLAFVFRLGSAGLVDPTPFAFVISGFAILFGMMRYQLFDITPIALDQVVENMRDGVVVVDVPGRIISLNHRAEQVLGISRKTIIGTPIASVLPGTLPLPDPEKPDQSVAEYLHEIEQETNGLRQYLELRCIPIISYTNVVKGRLIMIRDISEQKVAELGLLQAKKKLALLSGITRHDILNQVTGLLLSIDEARDAMRDPTVLEWLNRQENAIRIIQHQIEFARDYESLGDKAPQWMSINQVFVPLIPIMQTSGITFVPLHEDVELFADPLLERVFYILVDNSIQHGGKVTTISVRSIVTPDGLTILYEDNGVGVAAETKQKIFERGFGKHTGLGLFLAKEILEITGLSIAETGILGTGARFEIHVPPAQYRTRS